MPSAVQGTIVDSLDTLLVMGLEAEYQAALDKLHELDLYNLPHHEISVGTFHKLSTSLQ
jgi:hypothetical protein